MNAYEITRTDGTTTSVQASGYSWDKQAGGIAFYDSDGSKVATYRSGEWVALHMRSALVKNDMPAPKTTGITHADYMLMYGH
jgi:hypothetical protein